MDKNETIADFEEENILNIEEVINKYNSYIYTILKNSITNEQDIEEILSDVFMVLWKNRYKLDGNVNIKAYLIVTTRNLIKKKYRKYNMDYEFKDIEEFENKISSYIDIDELMEENEKGKIISGLIDKMKEEEKQIFIMFYYQNKKIREISKKLSISEAKVKVTLYRLRKLVKKNFKERGYNYGK